MIGQMLGPYQILEKLGEGGMGEVYKARDTRLDRSVAIKVLPPAFSADSDRRARFEREAKTIAGLNHPHICTVHDVGEHEGSTFLVMELLTGETLAQRLQKGPLQLEQALTIATEIADALAAAHRQGVIHRDLKPGNVALTKAGAKLLDFGLAKLKGHGEQPAAAHLATAPTQSTPLTGEGVILGTLQYMAPEQLEAGEADARTDVFAFGAVLYEMLTGRKAFEGKSQASLIASIMAASPPPVARAQPLAPPVLDRLIRICLAREPDDRWQTIHDVAAQLRWIAEGGSQVGTAAPVAARRRVRERWAWVAAAIFAVFAVLLLAGLLTTPRPARPEDTRFEIAPPPGVTLTWPRISPDGRTIAFVGSDARGTRAVWVRPLGSLEAVRLEGTDGVVRPFWSPDSRHLAFFAGGQLKKVPAAGGPTQLICESSHGADGSWSPQGVILFDGLVDDPIWRVPAGGGVPAVAMERDRARKEDTGPGWPFFLPDGRHYLFATHGATGAPVSLKVASIDQPGATTLMDIESRVEYTSDYVIYLSRGTLMARPFAPSTLSFGGDPFPVVDKMLLGELGLVNFSTSQAGDLAFIRQEQAQKSRLVWLDRTGREVGQVGEPGVYRDLALSPDQTRLAVAVASPTGGASDIWIYDLGRNTPSRFTFDEGGENWPVWSPDGQRLAYMTDKYGSFVSVAWKPSSGAGDEVLVRKEAQMHVAPTDWSPDGRSLVVIVADAALSYADIMLVPLSKGAEPTAVLRTPGPEFEAGARLSPDGRWMAYTSNESKRDEVYVQPFPVTGGKWQVSASGGSLPVWRADGKELFYEGLDDTFYAVKVATTGVTFEAGLPAKLFQRTLQHAGVAPRHRWAVTRDGQRFLVNVVAESAAVTPIQVVLHWAPSLQRTPR